MDGAATEQAAAPSYILAIDTSLGACSACCLSVRTTETAAIESVLMERGHSDTLVPLLDRVVSRIDGGFAGLARIAVTIGPGSFTGIRIGVAAARAIGLACKRPVVGVSTLSALAAPAIATRFRSTVVAAIDAHHGNVYVQSFSADGATLLPPAVLSVVDAVAALGRGPLRMVGTGAPMLATEAWSRGVNAEVDEQMLVPDITFVARLGLLAEPERAVPRPLYLRAADAKPPTSGVIARAD